MPPRRASRRSKAAVGGGRGAALRKPVSVSPELAKIVGKSTLPRTEITKQLWVYIKKKNLQDPNSKRDILAHKDQAFRDLFGKDKFSMFEMAKLVQKHITA